MHVQTLLTQTFCRRNTFSNAYRNDAFDLEHQTKLVAFHRDNMHQHLKTHTEKSQKRNKQIIWNVYLKKSKVNLQTHYQTLQSSMRKPMIFSKLFLGSLAALPAHDPSDFESHIPLETPVSAGCRSAGMCSMLAAGQAATQAFTSSHSWHDNNSHDSGYKSIKASQRKQGVVMCEQYCDLYNS